MAPITDAVKDDPFLKLSEVADLGRVTTPTARTWIRRGLLPATRLPGGAIRVKLSDFTRFMQQNRAR